MASSKKRARQVLDNAGVTRKNARLPLQDIESRFLRQIFNLARRRIVTAQERMEVVLELERRIARLEERVILQGERTKRRRNYGCAAFGVKNAKELAELCVKDFERMKIVPRTFRAFLQRARIEGYRSRVRGRLFHLFVRNFKPLQRDFLEYAAEQVKELNEPAVRGYYPPEIVPPAPKLINARGEELPRLVRFGQPRRAQEVRILKTNGRAVEFVDDMYVAYAQEADAKLWSFLSEIEVKTASAARGFGKQIGFSQIRLGADDVKDVEMIVEGFKKPVKVRPEHIIFSQRSIDRNAVTLLSKRSWARLANNVQFCLAKAMEKGDMIEIYRRSGFRFQVTTKGHGDVFRRVSLAIHNDYLNAFVQAILPAIHQSAGKRT